MSDTRKTLRDFFGQLGTPASSKIHYNLDNEVGEEISLNNENDLGEFRDADNKPRKLISETDGFLGNYLKFIVKNENNLYYPADNNLIVELGDRGTPINTETTPQVNLINKKTFLDPNQSESDKDGVNYLNRISLSNYFKSVRAVDDMPVDKTGGDASKSGHKLFKEIEGTDLNPYDDINSNARSENDVLNLIEDYIIQNNRFGNVGEDLNPYMGDGNSDNVDNLDYNINDRYGHSDESKTVKIDNLKNLGEELLKKATGFSSEDLTIENNNLLSAAESNFSFGYGKKISTGPFSKLEGSAYRSKTTSQYPEDENGNKIRQQKGDFVNQNSDSFGSTFNSEINFYKKNKNILLLHARLASLVMYSTFNNIYKDIIDSLSQQNNETDIVKFANVAIESGKFVNLYGKAKGLPSLRLDALREKYITKTIYPYSDCVERGMEICLSKATIGIENSNSFFDQGAGYWFSVCNAVIKRSETNLENLNESLSSDGELNLRELLYSFTQNGYLRFFNAMAVVGDTSLRSTRGLPLTIRTTGARSSFYDVDELEDTPGNRVSKSKMKNGKRYNQLSYAQSTVPSIYLLPLNTVRSSIKMEAGPRNPNPLRAHFGSDLIENTYLSVNNDGSGGRIPNGIVKELEDRLDAEYVPFYIQDLRTNEIISFHAFLSSLTDQINPNFNSQGAYGRMDDVHIYNNTKRSITCTFTLMATSQEDFDNMWYKINKITTLLYPQWTEGQQVSRDGSKFIQPFSQVIGASPIVRLRIGDVIKSNYSKYNLGRVFGIGNKGTSVANKGIAGFAAKIGDSFQEVAVNAISAIYGSPAQFENTTLASTSNNFIKAGIGIATDIVVSSIKNGFVNPLALDPVLNQLKDPNGQDLTFWRDFPDMGDKGHSTKLGALNPVILKPNTNEGYLYQSGQKIKFNRPITILIESKKAEESRGKKGKLKYRTKYKCKIIDPSLVEGGYFNKFIFCYHEDIYPLPNTVFSNTLLLPLITNVAAGTGSGFGILKELGAQAASAIPSVGTGAASVVNMFAELLESHENKFLNAENNPFTRAFETTMGRGLAGKLGGITFDWLDQAFPWETDYNSRAPMGCKITFSLDVIHDIPPGLDYAGYNRAPLYNVGRVMKDISGDVYNDGGMNSETYYNKSRTIKKG